MYHRHEKPKFWNTNENRPGRRRGLGLVLVALLGVALCGLSWRIGTPDAQDARWHEAESRTQRGAARHVAANMWRPGPNDSFGPIPCDVPYWERGEHVKAIHLVKSERVQARRYRLQLDAEVSDETGDRDTYYRLWLKDVKTGKFRLYRNWSKESTETVTVRPGREFEVIAEATTNLSKGAQRSRVVSTLNESEEPVRILGWSVDKIGGSKKIVPEIDDALLYVTNDNQAEVSVEVEVPGTNPEYTLRINGVTADGTGTAQIGLIEGRNKVVLFLRDDSTGQTDIQEIEVVRDQTPPVIEIATPSQLKTHALSFLFVNGNSEQENDGIINSAQFPRFVSGTSYFKVDGAFKDASCNVFSGSWTLYEANAVAGNADIKYPFHDYATNPPSGFSQLDTDEFDIETGPQAAFETPTVAEELEDSTREELGGTVNRIYALKIVVADELENEAIHWTFFKVDTTSPRVTGLANNHWGIHGLEDPGPTAVRPGPLAGIVAEDDTVGAYEGEEDEESLLRAWNGGPWMLATPRTLETEASNAEPAEIYLEDLAGNRAPTSYTAFHEDNPAGSYEERYLLDERWYNEYDDWWEYMDGIWGSAGANSIAKEDDQIKENPPAQMIEGFQYAWEFYLPPAYEDESGDEYLTERVSLDTVTLDGVEYVARPPSWEPRRTHTIAAEGNFIETTGDFIHAWVAADTFVNYDTLPSFPAATPTTENNYHPFFLSGALNNQITLKRDAPYNLGLSQTEVSVSSEWRKTAHQVYEYDEDFRYQFTKIQSAGYTVIKPRCFAIFDLSQDSLNAGQTLALRIYGYFGAEVEEGDTLAVSVEADGGTGEVSVLAKGETPADYGAVVIDDPFNRTAYHTLEVTVRAAVDASGPFKIVIGEGATAITLSKALLVHSFAILVDANHDEEIDSADSDKLAGQHGVAMAAGFGLTGHPTYGTRVQAKIDLGSDTQWMAWPHNTYYHKRGVLSVTCNNPRVRIYASTDPEAEPLKAEDLTWHREDTNLDQDTYVEQDEFGAYSLKEEYWETHSLNWPYPGDITEVSETTVQLQDSMGWFTYLDDGEGGTTRTTVSSLPDLWVDFPADEMAELTLTYLNAHGGSNRTMKLNLVRLSNGLSGPDGVAPHLEVVPGLASINLASGNLHITEPVQTYAMERAPSVVVSYNSACGIETGLGRGWQTNWDMRVFDSSIDKNLDGQVTPDEREDGDVLVLIDQLGSRSVLIYSEATSRFKNSGQGAWPLAEVGIDPVTAPGTNEWHTGWDPEGATGYAYKLLTHINLFYYFGLDGRLMRVENLGGWGVSVTRDSSGNAQSIEDDYGRFQQLDKASLTTASGELVTDITGRQARGWTFGYEEVEDDDEHQRVNSISIAGVLEAMVYFLEPGENELVNTGKAYKVERKLLDGVNPNDVYRWTIEHTSVDEDESPRKASKAAEVAEAFVHQPGGGETVTAQASTDYSVIDPAKDAWTTMAVEGITTVRTLHSTFRRVASLTRGRYNETLAYDLKANLQTRTINTSGSANLKTTWNYYSDSFLEIPGSNLLAEEIVDGAGGKTTYTYESEGSLAGLVSKVTDPSGDFVEFEYGDIGDGREDFVSLVRHGTPADPTPKLREWTVLQRNLYGQPTLEEAPDGVSERETAYTDTGKVRYVTDILQYTTVNSYDSQDRLVAVTSPGGASESMTLDALGRATVRIDVNGYRTETAFDGLGRTMSVAHTDASEDYVIDPQVFTYEFNADGQRVTVTRGERILSIEQFDVLGRSTVSYTPSTEDPEQEPPDNLEDAETAKLTVESEYYPSEGWLKKATRYADATQQLVTEYFYDNAGRQIEVKGTGGQFTKTAYHKAGWPDRVISAGHEAGQQIETRTTFDASGRPKFSFSPAKPNAGDVAYVETRYEFGQIVERKDSKGKTETFEFNENGLPSAYENPLGVQEVTEYLFTVPSGLESDLDGQVYVQTTTIFPGQQENAEVITKALDERGFPNGLHSIVSDAVTELDIGDDGQVSSIGVPGVGDFGTSRDALYRVTGTTTPFGGTTTVFDANTGDLLTKSTPRGLVYTFERDEATGQTKSVKDTLSDTLYSGEKLLITALRNKIGEVTKSLDASGVEHFKAIDYAKREVTAKRTEDDPQPAVTTFAPSGAVLTAKLGNLTPASIKHDTFGNSIYSKDPSGIISLAEADKFNRKKWTSVGGLKTELGYNDEDQMISAKAPGRPAATYAYKSWGALWKITDPNGKVTEHHYDIHGRKTKTTYADTNFEEWTYNGLYGRNDSMTDRGGRYHKYFYEVESGYSASRGLVTKEEIYEDDTETELLATIQFGYDEVGARVSQTYTPAGGSGETVSRTFDLRGRVETVVHPGMTTTFAYRNDNQMKTKVFDGRKLTYNYFTAQENALHEGRLKSVAATDTNGSNDWGTITYGIDNYGRPNSEALPGGIVREITSFDDAGRPKVIEQTVDSTTETISYAHTPWGGIKSLTSDAGYAHQFGFDGAARVASDQRVGTNGYRKTMTFDNLDNRLTLDTLTSFTVTPSVLTFDSFPEELTALVGNWDVDNGELLGQVEEGEILARAGLDLPANAGSRFSVKVKPDAADLAPGWAIQGTGTFDSGAKADILWRRGDGNVLIWLMDGASVSGGGDVASATNDWKIEGTGDFDGDGKSDILWRNDDGEVYLWLMDGTTVDDEDTVAVAGAEWTILGVGDFDGDGKSDILWKDTDGEVVIWFMDGYTATTESVATVGEEWTFAGVGDLDGDGKSDIVWRSDTHEIYAWLMDAEVIDDEGSVTSTVERVKVHGMGDFNGDGKSDILVSDSVSSQAYVWTMNGLSVSSYTATSTAPAWKWTFQAIGDLNGDGKDDLVWRDTAGMVQAWLMDGATVSSSTDIQQVTPLTHGETRCAGFTLGETEDGRYFAGLEYRKIADGLGGEVLSRTLKVYWHPDEGNSELLAEGEALPYEGGYLTLHIEFLSNSVSAWIEEDEGNNIQGIFAALPYEHEGGVGLEASGNRPPIITDAAGTPNTPSLPGGNSEGGGASGGGGGGSSSPQQAPALGGIVVTAGAKQQKKGLNLGHITISIGAKVNSAPVIAKIGASIPSRQGEVLGEIIWHDATPVEAAPIKGRESALTMAWQVESGVASATQVARQEKHQPGITTLRPPASASQAGTVSRRAGVARMDDRIPGMGEPIEAAPGMGMILPEGGDAPTFSDFKMETPFVPGWHEPGMGDGFVLNPGIDVPTFEDMMRNRGSGKKPQIREPGLKDLQAVSAPARKEPMLGEIKLPETSRSESPTQIGKQPVQKEVVRRTGLAEGRPEARVQVELGEEGTLAFFDSLSSETHAGDEENLTYTYNDLNQLTHIDGPGEDYEDLYYNTLGLMTSHTKNGASYRTFAYDPLNRLTTLTPASGPTCTYSYFGPSWMRKSMTVGSVTTQYFHDGFACLKQITDTTTTHYAVPGSTALWENDGTTTLTYAKDGRGNVTGMWNGNSYAAQYAFDAHGVRNVVSGTASHASTPGYRGQLHDESTGDIYLRNRNYTPGLGRFRDIDPIGLSGGLNMYNYCASNPVDAWDPMGLETTLAQALEDGKITEEEVDDLVLSAGEARKIMEVAGLKAWDHDRVYKEDRKLAWKAYETFSNLDDPYTAYAERLNDIAAKLYLRENTASAQFRGLIANAFAQGTKEAGIAVPRGVAAYYTAGISECAITGYEVSQAKTVSEVDQLLWNNAKVCVLNVLVKGNENFGATGNFWGKSLEVTPWKFYETNHLSLQSEGLSASNPTIVVDGTAQTVSRYQYQAEWGRLAVQERTAAFKAILQKSGYRGEFAFGAYWDNCGNVRIALASTEPTGYVPKAIRNARTSTGFPMWATHETHIVGGMTRGFHAETKLLLTVRPYYLDAAGGAKYICKRQCTPLVLFEDVQTSTPFQQRPGNKPSQVFVGEDAVLRYLEGQKWE